MHLVMNMGAAVLSSCLKPDQILPPILRLDFLQTQLSIERKVTLAA